MDEKLSDSKIKTTDKKIGAVLVVGAGIGGVQASLDLADSGYKVYLVEQSPAIGGIMSQLDKTFPTNDCSMCILSPKLVDCARHNNIELLTYSKVEEVSGEPGNFTVKVNRQSRYVDESKCTGCGECEKVCPVRRPSEFDKNLSTRKAIYRPLPQATPNVFTIEKRGLSPCTNACPAGCNAHGYVALIRERKFQEALELIRERIPLPAICGRVCGFCEEECNRANRRKKICAICAICG
jgi:heterodisulfide reductase subunit A-like polyferredoxin